MYFRDFKRGFFIYPVVDDEINIFFACPGEKDIPVFSVINNKIQRESKIFLLPEDQIKVIPIEEWRNFNLNLSMIKDFDSVK